MINNLKKFFSQNFKALLLPAALIAVSLYASYFIFTNLYARIKKNASGYGEVKNVEALMDDKLLKLKSFKVGAIDPVSTVLVALPDKSPVAWEISNLRIISQRNSGTIRDFRVLQTAIIEDKIRKTEVGIKLDFESLETLISFLRALGLSAPLTSVEKVFVDKKGEESLYHADIEVAVYWAKLPISLPALTEKITDLSEDEMALLAEVSSLTFPIFSFLDPVEPQDRPAPFN